MGFFIPKNAQREQRVKLSISCSPTLRVVASKSISWQLEAEDTMPVPFSSWLVMANPPPKLTPLRNEGLTAGLIRETMVG